MKDKILIFIITYKASYRVLNVIKKIPYKYFRGKNVKILISDDNSKDDTVDIIKNIKNKYKSKVLVRFNKENLGYGANIKKCITYAYKNYYDYAVMIHGDNQYDPKYSSIMIDNLLKNKKITAVTGSRMTRKLDALRGKMPIYKFVGNFLLTKIFNLIYNTKFTDCHTGYWAYNLKKIEPSIFKKLDNKFCFDIDFRLEMIKRKKQIKEISIKTFYGTERSSIHFIYALRFFYKIILYKFLK